MNVATQSELDCLRQVDFNWATRLQDVWTDSPFDVPALHGELRKAFSHQIASMKTTTGASPLGWLLVGSGGVGKTHLLGAMRQECTLQGVGFVLVDMTDVRDFWDVVLQGYIDSLQSPYGDEYEFQYQQLLFQFIRSVSQGDEAARNLKRLASRKTNRLANDAKQIIMVLRKRCGKLALQHQDSVRALICLNSDDIDIASAGYTWLQGQEIDDQLKKDLGFLKQQQSPIEIVRALSWVMSLSGPTVVAFDQLDPIVQQVKHQSQEGLVDSEQEGTARAIVEQIGGGLGAMRDVTSNTLAVVSCVEQTLDLMKSLVFGTYLDRFETAPRTLKRPNRSDVYEMLIGERLNVAYQESGVTPPYPTWPFSKKAIAQLQNESAREVLKLCEQHRRFCLESGKVHELKEFTVQKTPGTKQVEVAEDFDKLDQLFAQFRSDATPDDLIEEKSDDDRLAPLYQFAFECLILENADRLPEHIDPVVEHEFTGGKSTKPLHARLRIIDHNEGSREFHYCLRAIQRKHATAFQSRLKAAMTQSGIDKALKFRKLLIVRTFPTPGGGVTEKLIRKFRDAGGVFHQPDSDELATLYAVERLRELGEAQFNDWLVARRPVTQTALAGAIGVEVFETASGQNEKPTHKTQQVAINSKHQNPTTLVDPPATGDPTPSTAQTPPSGNLEKSDAASESATEIVFGHRFSPAGGPGPLVSVPVDLLKKHTIILGGSGSGKSVTVRRLVEEAALAGIPSIVVDCAQDMCCFNTTWTEPQTHWRDGDSERAQRFLTTTEQIVWTPGSIGDGNPLTLRPLPDFTSVKDSPQELEDALNMACDGLNNVVAKGSSQKAENSRGILKNSLKYFAQHYPDQGLKGFIGLLNDLPPEAKLGIKNEEKLAEEMATALTVAQVNNPLLNEDGGAPLDPLILFGDDQPTGKTRISVVSLVKLKSLTAAHSFLNQLAMELFSWIKQNPTPPNQRPLRGLLVIDEARDFLPSQKSTECKESIMRLAAQARKYGLGLVFATQHPKDIDTKIVGNCATHLYGLNNSPASLATLEDLMAQRGGSGKDIGQLKTGQFYVYNSDAGHAAPLKTQIPMSLSLSPVNPLEETRIVALAAKSNLTIGRLNKD